LENGRQENIREVLTSLEIAQKWQRQLPSFSLYFSLFSKNSSKVRARSLNALESMRLGQPVTPPN
jgi:hypothetical protein